MKVVLNTSSNKRQVDEENLNTSKKIKVMFDQHQITDPKYKIPLDYPEWKRQVVYRNNPKNGQIADVLYFLNFVLEDKEIKYQIKSLKQITAVLPEFEKYLICKGNPSSGLTVNNFTFIQKPLGINDSSKEIVRTAKQRRSHKRKAEKIQVKKKSLDVSTENSISENSEEQSFSKTTNDTAVQRLELNKSMKNLLLKEQSVIELTSGNFKFPIIPFIKFENIDNYKESIKKKVSSIPNIKNEESLSDKYCHENANFLSAVEKNENSSNFPITNITNKLPSNALVTEKNSTDKSTIKTVENAFQPDDVLKMHELENESTLESDFENLETLFQEMKDVQISAYLAMENKIKSTKTEFKNFLENKVLKVRQERQTNNLLLEKIKKLEFEFENKNKETEELKKSHENEILNLRNLYHVDIDRLRNQVLVDKDNYETQLQNEIQKSTELETELNEIINDKNNILKELGSIAEEFN